MKKKKIIKVALQVEEINKVLTRVYQRESSAILRVRPHDLVLFGGLQFFPVGEEVFG